MTTLADHMRRQQPHRTQAEWAALIGVSRSYLSEIASGSKRPSLDVAFRIERATKGAVPASSWVADRQASGEVA